MLSAPFGKAGPRVARLDGKGFNGLNDLRRWARGATTTLKSIPYSAGWSAGEADF